jgi:bilin biosynthesis protein
MSLFGKPDIDKLRGKRDVIGLIKALDYEKDRDIRLSAIQALGDIAAPEAFEPMVRIFQEEKRDPWERGEAVGALAAYGSRAADLLLSALEDDKYKDVQIAVAKTLGEIKDERAIDPLIRITKRESDVFFKGQFIEALSDFGGRTADIIVGFLGSKNSDIGMAAWDALIKIGSPAIPHVVVALDKGDANIKSMLVTILGYFGGEEVIEPLLAALDDRDLATEAIQSLERIENILPKSARAKLKQAQDKEMEEEISYFPQNWQSDPEKRATLISILKSPPNSNGMNCPYYRRGICRFRIMTCKDISIGPERCSLQTGSHTGCMVWQINPR